VKVWILGLEGQAVLTDAQGRFHFGAVPVGDVKLGIDGRTATNAPAGVYFPEMVMDLTTRLGVDNTVMASMGPPQQQAALAGVPGVYLPRLQTSLLHTMDASAGRHLGVDAGSAPDLTPEQRQLLSLDVPAGSLVGPDGKKLSSAQVGISTVPPELVRDMLPPGLLEHTFDITVQAPGVATFSTPVPLTFPNLFHAAPGSTLDFLSFDHTTGRLVIEGTATVSADGKSVKTDPGVGVTHPGWHGMAPPGSCGNGSPTYPPAPVPRGAPAPAFAPAGATSPGRAAGPVPQDAPEQVFALPLITASVSDQSLVQIVQPPPGPAPSPGPCSGGGPPRAPHREVLVEVDGALGEFMKARDDSVPLVSNVYELSPEDAPLVLAADPLTYDDMFTEEGGFSKLTRDRLYGAKVRITRTDFDAEGNETGSTATSFYQYRWVSVVNADEARDRKGSSAAFMRTLMNPLEAELIRTKQVDLFLPDDVETSFQRRFPRRQITSH
jgi:hypothetical protein